MPSRQISGAVAGDSSLQDRGVAHYVLSLLFSLVSLPLCPLSKIPKKLVTLLVVVIMDGPFAIGEAEVLTFTQRGGESLKDAWYRINDSQKRATKKHSTTILLRNFYVGITSWNRYLLDTAINGNFIEALVWEALNVIENLVGSLPVVSIKEDITLAHIMRKLKT